LLEGLDHARTALKTFPLARVIHFKVFLFDNVQQENLLRLFLNQVTSFKGISITCMNIPLEKVKSVLNQTTVRDFIRLELTIDSDKVPENFLSGKV